MNIPGLGHIDLRKKPYRGVVSELAHSENVSQQAISKALRMKNLRITTLLADAIAERRQAQAAEEKEHAHQVARIRES